MASDNYFRINLLAYFFKNYFIIPIAIIKNIHLLCISKHFFMNMENQSLQDIRDIKNIMERSTRFISLSGWSGVAAGICALAGSWIATKSIAKYVHEKSITYEELIVRFLVIAGCVFVAAFIFAFIFTYLRSKKNNVPMWGITTYRMLINLAIPLIAGGFFVIRILQMEHYFLIAPVCLSFYGLALINASKYTLGEIKYLGYCELILGIANLWIPGYGLIFWAAGFGLLHIIYGVIMWWKYERV